VSSGLPIIATEGQMVHNATVMNKIMRVPEIPRFDVARFIVDCLNPNSPWRGGKCVAIAV
jgi:hypothetical protein